MTGSSLRVVALALALGLLASAAGAEPVAVGESLPELALADQHGEPYAADASIRVLLFSRDMDGGRVIQAALEEDGAALLERQRALYVADVSRMPGFVRRFIAGPRMRKRPYRMMLDTEGEATAALPTREGLPAVFFVEDLRVLRIEHPESPEALRALLGEGGS